jgi:hypothetical protein
MPIYLGSGQAGDIYAGSTKISEVYAGSQLVYSSAIFLQATGGTISDAGGYRYHTFTTSGNFIVTALGSDTVLNTLEFVVIAGGAGGSNSSGIANGSGGAGAGGMIDSSLQAAVATYPLLVGEGGVGASTPVTPGGVGGNSQFNGAGGITTTRGGHGGGGLSSSPAVGGGSGGGAANNYSQAAGIAGQGNAGGTLGGYAGISSTGGGGGGAGAVGGNVDPLDNVSCQGGNGGDGRAWLNGVIYAGGGGGPGNYQVPDYGPDGKFIGGAGGGGNGNNVTSTNQGGPPTSATNYGSGGGTSANNTLSGGNGYQGIVIVRYPFNAALAGTQNYAPSEFVDFNYAPPIEPVPDHDPTTHYVTMNLIEHPMQASVGWTIHERE